MASLRIHKNFDNYLAEYELSPADLTVEQYLYFSEIYDELMEVTRKYYFEDSVNVDMYKDCTLHTPNPRKEYLRDERSKLELVLSIGLSAIQVKKEPGIVR